MLDSTRVTTVCGVCLIHTQHYYNMLDFGIVKYFSQLPFLTDCQQRLI